VALPLCRSSVTREIEDRVLAVARVARRAGKVTFGALQDCSRPCWCSPSHPSCIDYIHIHLQVHWLVLLTLTPLACVTCSALGLTFGTIFDPRSVPCCSGSSSR
jgi:hypothetical protein